MVQRRSRMHRTQTGKRLALTPRDVEIFRALARYRYLRSTYLHAFVGGESEKRFKERLGDLFHEGFIDRPSQQWQFAEARHMPVIYEIGKGAERILQERGRDAGNLTFLSSGAHRQFAHSVMICECLASIELATFQSSSLRFIPWPEILAKAPEATRRSARPYALLAANGGTVVPDAIFGLEYCRDGRKTYRFFALEADRGTMPIARTARAGTSILVKLEVYRSVLAQEGYRRSLSVPNLLVLTVTASEARCSEILERCSVLPADDRPFLFKAFDGMVTPDFDLLTKPWLRSREPALCIANAA